jgi:pimeloyl-ACP methyl ester carboxylesterase
MNFTERRFEFLGKALACKIWPHAHGEPTIALHGWLDNAATFDRLAPMMPNWHMVALDVSGHGQSDHRSKDATYHAMDWACEAAFIADELGFETFNLVGHSMGAIIALLLAGAWPKRIKRLILLDGLGPLSVPPHELPGFFARNIRERQRLTNKLPPLYATRELMAQRLCAMVENLTLDSARILVDRGSRVLGDGVTWSADPRLRGTWWMPIIESQFEPFLRAIEAPSLLVRAKQGYVMDEQILKERSRCFKELRTLYVEGGHHVHLDHPERIVDGLRLFCEDTRY